MCKKLKAYGLSESSVSWFNSFLTNRSQKVKVGNCLSQQIKLTSGVPQGGILSPLLYIIYVADLHLWLKYSFIITYADDTSSSINISLFKNLSFLSFLIYKSIFLLKRNKYSFIHSIEKFRTKFLN